MQDLLKYCKKISCEVFIRSLSKYLYTFCSGVDNYVILQELNFNEPFAAVIFHFYCVSDRHPGNSLHRSFSSQSVGCRKTTVTVK